MEKKVIKVQFCDFWTNFVLEESHLYKTLIKRYDVVICDEPDFLFYTCDSNKNIKYNNCVKIFYTAENVVPNFNKCDYGIGVDYITFEDRYLRFPPVYYNEQMRIMPEGNPAKRKFCNFVYNNFNVGTGALLRQEFCKKLAQYKHVDCPGIVLNNMKDAIEPRDGNWGEGKLKFIKDYKFTIAFENSFNNGYTTEKLTDPFMASSIPIYWGNPVVTRDFNPKSFINCSDFASFDDVIEYVKYLDNNDDLYLEMLNQPPLLYSPEEREKEWENFIYNIIEKGNKPFEKDLLDMDKKTYYPDKPVHPIVRRTKNFIRKNILKNK